MLATVTEIWNDYPTFHAFPQPDSTGSIQAPCRCHLLGPQQWTLSVVVELLCRPRRVEARGGRRRLGTCGRTLRAAAALLEASTCVLEKSHISHPPLLYFICPWAPVAGLLQGEERAGQTSGMQAYIPGWDSENINWEAPVTAGDCQPLTHPGSRLAPTKSVVVFNKRK